MNVVSAAAAHSSYTSARTLMIAIAAVGLVRRYQRLIGSRSDKVWAEIWPDIGPRIQHEVEVRRRLARQQP